MASNPESAQDGQGLFVEKTARVPETTMDDSVDINEIGSPDHRSDSDSMDDEEYMNSPAVQNCIRDHLAIAYPLNGQAECKTHDWLFIDRSMWPKDFLPFTFRYIHEHDLYRQGIASKMELSHFILMMKRQLGVTRLCTYYEDDKIFHKTMAFHAAMVRKWKVESRGYTGTFGIVHKQDDHFVRTPPFEEAWQTRRELWITQVHNGNTAHLLEFEPYSEVDVVPMGIPVSKFQFITTSAEAALDSSKPITLQELENSSLVDFLDLCKSRRPAQEYSIDGLEFVQRWGDGAHFSVNRDSTPEEWESARVQLRDNFLGERGQTAAGIAVEVWIRCKLQNIVYE